MIFSNVVLLLLTASADSPLPIEEDPRHRLEFRNEFVRVFDVRIGPGDATLFHTHVHDGVGLKLSDARIRDEVLDGKAEVITVARGTVNFSHRPGPLNHRVINIGTTPFLNTFVEILPISGSRSTTPLPALAPGHELVLENERVRVARRVLAPEQSIAVDARAPGGLTVALSDGAIAIESEGEDATTVTFERGNTRWHEGGSKSSWKYVGDDSFETVTIELK